MNGAGKKLWGYYPTTDVWVPLQVDADGKVVVDLTAVNLGDLGNVNIAGIADEDALIYDTATSKWVNVTMATLANIVAGRTKLDELYDCNVPAPTDGNVLYWDAGTSKWKDKDVEKRFYALDDSTVIWRAWGDKVSSTPRTATVSSIAGDVITLTANQAYRFGEWGSAPEYMNAASVYIMIRNTTRGENAWVKASPAANQLRVTAAADIAAWVNGDTISTYSTAGSAYEELDISPLIPDGATMVFLKTQCLDTGVAAYAKGLQVSKEGAAGTWSNTFVQVQNILVCAYPSTPIIAARHMLVRDRATGTDTLQHQINVIAYIK